MIHDLGEAAFTMAIGLCTCLAAAFVGLLIYALGVLTWKFFATYGLMGSLWILAMAAVCLMVGYVTRLWVLRE